MTKYFERILLTLGIAWVLLGAHAEFYQIAWGTGVWYGEFSRTWALLYYGFIFLCIVFFVIASLYIWKREFFTGIIESAISFRERLGRICWLFTFITLIFPVWFFQYTPWGLVFSDIYIRVLIWAFVVIGLVFFIKKGNGLFGWTEFIVAVFLTSSEFVIIVPFSNVTNYPFSLGWSEGNRLWDYSIMFGRHLYDYPADRNIPVLLDVGREFIGGLPFIFPGITIGIERFWIGLTVVLPYIFLGLAAFRSVRKDLKVWFITVMWVLMFLRQGPIHPPLVFCAVAVALLWRSPLWIAIPLIAVTGYAAQASRFIWLFAPGMWIGMLELAGADLQEGRLSRASWFRAVFLGLVGMAGGYFGPKIVGLLAGHANATTAISVEGVTTAVSEQPFLWYRLLPNATYGMGILAGLLIATLPLIVVLFYLIRYGKLKLNIWQALAIVSPLLAFLVVGLIASTKIGGGGDLHNMDMFLIGLTFTAVIAWERNKGDWFTNINLSPVWFRLVILLLFAIPGFQVLEDMRPHNFTEDASRFVTLTDAPNETALNMYPSQEITNSSLDAIRREVALVRSQGGEVLFMDQRQLLTFGYITGVPLIPEYEKKVLMNQALSSDANYFKLFYTDLAAKRFSLIVSEQLRTPVKDSSFQFGEENNAWVKWVSIPTLCYYEPKVTLKEVGVQLLVPRTDTSDCSSLIPEEAVP